MRSKARLTPGEIVLVPFPFTDLSHTKVRPAVVLAHDGDDMTVCFITSIQPKGKGWIEIVPSRENGIKVRSFVKYTKIATLDTQVALCILGTLEAETHKTILRHLVQFLTCGGV